MRQIDAALNHLIPGRYHHFCAIKFMTTTFTVLTQLTLLRKMYLKRENKLALETDVFDSQNMRHRREGGLAVGASPGRHDLEPE